MGWSRREEGWRPHEEAHRDWKLVLKWSEVRRRKDRLAGGEEGLYRRESGDGRAGSRARQLNAKRPRIKRGLCVARKAPAQRRGINFEAAARHARAAGTCSGQAAGQ